MERSLYLQTSAGITREKEGSDCNVEVGMRKTNEPGGWRGLAGWRGPAGWRGA